MNRNEYLYKKRQEAKDKNKDICSSGLTKFRCLFYCFLQCVVKFYSLFMLFMLNDQNISGVIAPPNIMHRYM